MTEAADLNIRIRRDERRVIIDFGSNVSAVEFYPHEALLLAERLKIHGESLMRQNGEGIGGTDASR